MQIDNNCSQHSTLIEIIAQDRPGLLYDISSAMAELGCNIEVAIIDTQGQTATDVFHVTCAGTKLDLRHQEKMRTALRRTGGPIANRVGTDVLICPVERSSTVLCRHHKLAELRSAGQMRTSVPTWSVALSQVSLQRILPAGHCDAALLQTLWRQHGILRTFCRAHELVAGSLAHDCVESRTGDDFARKLVPGALTAVGDVHYATRFLAA